MDYRAIWNTEVLALLGLRHPNDCIPHSSTSSDTPQPNSSKYLIWLSLIRPSQQILSSSKKAEFKYTGRKAGSSSTISYYPCKKTLEDKLKETNKGKEPEDIKQQKNIQKPFVKNSNLNRPSTPRLTGDDSSVCSKVSFPFDVSFVIDFMPSTKE
ncbi:hypothetical protein TNCV_2768261 [Trichonephila clavipes]|nr:hypothetical protein TNCV_2768261 [Trichonephila clavipes]